MANALGIGTQVQFLGVVRDVPERLMAHQLAVLATHYEGMPLALLEGMAAGCAVIGSAVPGVREVLEDGVDGLLVNESDPVAMADALERVLRNPAPVSYTHLDVYKRQMLCLGRCCSLRTTLPRPVLWQIESLS